MGSTAVGLLRYMSALEQRDYQGMDGVCFGSKRESVRGGILYMYIMEWSVRVVAELKVAGWMWDGRTD